MYETDASKKTAKRIVDSINDIAVKGKSPKNYLKDGKSVVNVDVDDKGVAKNLGFDVEKTAASMQKSSKKIVVDID